MTFPIYEKAAAIGENTIPKDDVIAGGGPIGGPIGGPMVELTTRQREVLQLLKVNSKLSRR